LRSVGGDLGWGRGEIPAMKDDGSITDSGPVTCSISTLDDENILLRLLIALILVNLYI